MKRIFALLVVLSVLAATTPSYAQGFGVKGSFNFFNLAQKNALGNKVENTMIPKFDVGLFYEASIAPEFYLRPELNFAAKGAKLEGTPESKLQVNYLEVPVMFLYKGALSGGNVMLGFGPYLGLGVGGKNTGNGNEFDIKFKGDVSSAEAMNTLYLKPLDFGGKMLAGYEFGMGLSFAINASFGMSNMAPKLNGEKQDATLRNVGFGLTLGYRFGKK